MREEIATQVVASRGKGQRPSVVLGAPDLQGVSFGAAFGLETHLALGPDSSIPLSSRLHAAFQGNEGGEIAGSLRIEAFHKRKFAKGQDVAAAAAVFID